VDDDETRTGERFVGSFESIFSWFLRFTSTVFHAIYGFVVVDIGFDIALGTEKGAGVCPRMIYLRDGVTIVFLCRARPLHRISLRGLDR
jgi:Na+/melibiose symporter-like transporter